MPPVVPSHSIRSTSLPLPEDLEKAQGVLLGNFWDESWLEALSEAIEDLELEIDWYGNHAGLVDVNVEELSEKGIHFRGQLPEEELFEVLIRYAFSLLPSDPGSSEEPHWLAQYSLPTRLFTSLACANLPCLVLGVESTAAARFVEEQKVGQVVAYESDLLSKAVEQILDPKKQRSLRDRIAEIAPLFGADGLDDWIKGSIQSGSVPDSRFDVLLPAQPLSLVPYIEESPPSWVFYGDVAVWEILHRLDRQGMSLDFFVDVGASNGMFTHLTYHSLTTLQDRSRLILIDPLFQRHVEKNSHYIND